MEHDVMKLLHDLPAYGAYELIVLQRALIQARDEPDLRAFLLWLQAILPSRPPILIVAVDHSPHKVRKIIEIDWPSGWTSEYVRKKFHRVDPVLLAEAGRLILWYETLHRHVPENPLAYKRYLETCELAGMLYGASYTVVRDNHQITISMVGREVEDDREVHALIERICGAIADAASRIMIDDTSLHKMTEQQRKIFSLIINEELTSAEIAQRLGISERTVNWHLSTMRQAYGVTTTKKLIALALTKNDC